MRVTVASLTSGCPDAKYVYSSSTMTVKFMNTSDDTIRTMGTDTDTSLLAMTILAEISPSCWLSGVCVRMESTADCPFSKLKTPSLSCELPKLMNEIKLVLGSTDRTLLAAVLPVFVTLNSNTLDLPRIILVLTEGGSIDSLGRIGSIRRFTVIWSVVPWLVSRATKNSPLSGLATVSRMSISSLSPGSNVSFEGVPRSSISTPMYLVYDTVGVAVSPFRVPGPSLHTTVAL